MPALFTSAIAVSVALGIPPPSPPGQARWIAVVMDDGDVEVGRDGGASAMIVARCPALSEPIERAAAAPGAEDEPDPSDDRAQDSEDPGSDPGDDLESDPGDDPESDPGDDLESDPGDNPDPADDRALDPSGGPFGDNASPFASGVTGELGVAHEAAPRAACGLPQPPAQIAWREDALYIACATGPVYRWREDTGTWPVQLTAPGALDAALPALTQVAPDRFVAILGGAEIQLVDASQRLWALSHAGESASLRQIGAVPEPVAALATWRGTLVAAGATAVWRRSGPDGAAVQSWEPLMTITACALSADGDSLWLAGPTGLVELSGEQVRVHALSPLSGLAISDGDIWLTCGRGSVVRAPLAAAASAMLAGTLAAVPESESPIVSSRRLRALHQRARWARWLPDLAAHARYTRSRSGPGATAAASWADAGPGSYVCELTLIVWLTWTLDPDHPATAAARSWP